MLLVQKFLETHSFEELQHLHGVYASFSKSGHKWSLNYDQIEAKESDLLAQECRGLILSCDHGKSILPSGFLGSKPSYNHICPGKTKILAFPMKRFFNYGQGAAANINWSDKNISVLEKLDGTLCIVYFDTITDKWCVATRSVPEADLIMDNGIFTFRTLFEKALYDSCGLSFDLFAKNLNKENTYCFELTTPYNRIVVNYESCRITLLAVRNIVTSQELDILDLAEEISGISLLKKYQFTSINGIVDWVSSLDPLQMEGVVIKDAHFNRIKVKNAAYVAFNKCRDTLSSERNRLEIILLEKEDDVVPFLPDEISKDLFKIKRGLQNLIKNYDECYASIKLQADQHNLGDKKTFAKLVTVDHPELWSAPFFQMYDKKCDNFKDFILKNKKNGIWGDSFLDKILELCKKYS